MLYVENLEKSYKSVQALRGVSFEVQAGETLAVVGESGCGKSTLAKVLMKIETPSNGQMKFEEKDIQNISTKELPQYLQMVFQDPYSSLNPRKKIFDIVAEPLKVKGHMSSAEIKEKVESVAQTVGLRPELLERYPHMMSGGQRQRVGIARALVTEPRLLICDEPVSALDVSVQAQVLNLLLDLQQNKKLSFLFISHDLGVVRFLAHRVAVMYLGKFVEIGTREKIFNQPLHPYTKLLLGSSPQVFADADDAPAENTELPSPSNPPSGCTFHTRCPLATELCRSKEPKLEELQGVKVACHHV